MTLSTRWGSAIEAVKADLIFKKYHGEYCGECKRTSSHKKTFYDPLMNTMNATLDVLSWSTFDNMPTRIPQHYWVNDLKRPQGGVFNKFNLSPDILLLHKDL